MAEWTKATVLKTVMLRTPVNEWLDPMKEAPSFEEAFLVSETPPSGSLGDGVLVTVGVWLPSRMPSSNLGPSGSSSATPNLAWNSGQSKWKIEIHHFDNFFSVKGI